jgi:hypothetical protein
MIFNDDSIFMTGDSHFGHLMLYPEIHLALNLIGTRPDGKHSS